jgi:hypothetical protein
MSLRGKLKGGKVTASFESGIVSPVAKRRVDARGAASASVLALTLALLVPGTTSAQKTSLVSTASMVGGPGHEMVGVPCQVNGTDRRYVCVIDSGATFTIISDRVLRAEGPTIDMTTGNGKVRVHQRDVSLTIAEGLELRARALVQSRMLEGIDILLGQDVLRQFKYVTFDYENRKVEFQR